MNGFPLFQILFAVLFLMIFVATWLNLRREMKRRHHVEIELLNCKQQLKEAQATQKEED